MATNTSAAGNVPVGKGDAGGGNTLDSKIELPCVDGHCHLFGSSLSSADSFHAWSESGQVVVVQVGTNGVTRLRFAPGTKIKTWKLVTGHGFAAWSPNKQTLDARAVVEATATPWPPPTDSEGYLDVGKGGAVLDLGLGKSKGTVSSLGDRFGGLAHAVGNDGSNAAVCLDGIPRQSARAAVSLLLDLGYTGLPVPNVNAVLWAAGVTPRCMPDPDGFFPSGKSYFWGKREGIQFTVEALAEVAARYPGEVWPLVPFDPRRAVKPPAGEPRSPLEIVKYAVSSLGFAGVKLYTRCGWMPLNNAKIHPKHGAAMDGKLRELYSYLVAEDLPVLNHTSPTGFPPAGMLDLPPVYETGHPDVPRRGDELWAGDYTGEEGAARWAISAAWASAQAAANYNHYIQLTVSPYSWEAVLKEYPKLRLCFAHSGGRVSALAKFCESRFDPTLWDELNADWAAKTTKWRKNYEDFGGEAKGPLCDLYTNACVASGKWFRESLFEQSCIVAADELLQCKIPRLEPQWTTEVDSDKVVMYFSGNSNTSFLGYAYSTNNEAVYKSRTELRAMVQAEIKKLLASPPWSTWLKSWEASYPLDWYSKIIQLYKNSSYPNLYSDIAYYSGEQETWFKRLLKPFSDYAKQDTVVAQKTIFGTDWWMTEMDSIDPKTFWTWCGAVIDSRHPMWNQWTSTNPVKWINMRKRMDGMEAWCKKNNPAAVMPAWWAAMKKHYDSQTS